MSIDQLHHYLRQFGMHTAIAKQHSIEPCQHRGAHLQRRKQSAYARAVATDQIILKHFPICVRDAVLGHRTEAGIDAINELILGKGFEKVVAATHLRHRIIYKCDRIMLNHDLIEGFERKGAFAEGNGMGQCLDFKDSLGA